MPVITRDPVGASSTVNVAPEHFVSSTVVKVPIVGDLKAGSVRLTAVVTNVRSGNRRGSADFAPSSSFPFAHARHDSLIRADARRFTTSLLRNSLRCENASLLSPASNRSVLPLHHAWVLGLPARNARIE